MNTLQLNDPKGSNYSIKYELVIPENDLLIEDVSVSSISEKDFKHEFDSDNGNVVCEGLNKSEKADKLDYEIALACGVLAGLLDSLWVGGFDLARANTWGKEKINEFVKHVAKKDNLEDAIKHLEKNAPFIGDKYKSKFGDGRFHHMRDFGHHFSLFGLTFSLLTQFTKKCYGTDVHGKFIKVPIDNEHLENPRLIGKNFHEKIFLGTIQWYLHVVSDMAGSNQYAGEGTGIPGPIVSSMKMMATLPIFKATNDKGHKEVSVLVQKLFNGTLIKYKDKDGKEIRFDLRTEVGILNELSRQMRPIIINECLVRGLFCIRRLHKELADRHIKTIQDIGKVDFRKTVPWRNRALQRMLTVSTGTMEVIDLCDAAIRAAIKNKGFQPGFWKDFAIRLNFIGIGRFVIALKNDGSYVLQDLAEYKDEKKAETIKQQKEAYEFEREISRLEAFLLSEEQYKILNSLKLIAIDYDVKNTKNAKDSAKKIAWKQEWKSLISERLNQEFNENEFAYKTEAQVYSQIEKLQKESASSIWLYLLTLELVMFKPYFRLNSENDKDYKKLKLSKSYLKDVFPEKQKYIDLDVIKRLEKTEQKAYDNLTGKTNRTIASIAGVSALMLLTGGFATVFAPEIAVALVGESFVGIYGAALTNASLAALGGGSLAVGGMGMAGGTMMITGGASLLGMASGTGMATTMALLSTEGYGATECAKMYTICKSIFIEKYSAVGLVQNVVDTIDHKIVELEIEASVLKEIEITDKDEKEKAKKQAKIIDKNIKYYKKCSKELAELVKKTYRDAK